jgi:3-oxoadipate enol-lactonase
MPTRKLTVPVPGGRLHAVIDGDGPPILLVHAGIVDLRAWDALVPHLVGAGYRVIRYDLRGFGQSTTDDVEFSARADLRAVLDATEVERAALVGNSLGAMTCLDTIIESPARAVAFTWVGGGIGGFDGATTAEELALFERMASTEEAHDGAAVAELDLAVWVDGVGQPPGRVPAAIRDAVRMMDQPLYDPGRTMGTRLELDPPANDRLGEIRIPVLAVVGALDVTDVRDAAVRLEEAVPGARRVVLPDVAHMVGMEAPDRLAALILDLVRPLGAWA